MGAIVAIIPEAGHKHQRQAGAGDVLACVMGDLDLVRPLGLAGIRCALVTPVGSVAARSRFCRAVIPWDGGDIADGETGGAEEGADELLLHLERFAASQPDPPVLLYQEDEQLLFVSRNRDRLARKFRFVVADPALVEDLVDKARFQALAERLSLPVPATRLMRPAIGSPPPEIGLRFPVIVKPLRRRRSWSSSGYTTKALPIATQDALGAWWPQWAQQGMELLAQELVPGPESCIESYHVYVDQHGDIAGEFTGRKLRTLPAAFGYSTALTLTDAEDVTALGRSLVANLGLSGVAKFDFKRGPEGRLYLLEVNPRFNLWHHLGAVAGVNLPALVYRDLLGLPRAATPARARAGVQWCRLSDDWRAAKESGIPLRAWLPWALRCEAKSVVWDDPMPFVQTIGRAVSQGLTARTLT